MTKPTLYIGWTGHQCASTTHEACTDQHHAYRPASPGEILAAARPHADYEVATDVADELLGKLTAHYADVVAIVDAALGADDE